MEFHSMEKYGRNERPPHSRLYWNKLFHCLGRYQKQDPKFIYSNTGNSPKEY